MKNIELWKNLIPLFSLLYVSCGTLGGIGDVLYFPVSKNEIEVAIDSLYSEYPNYILPKKWEKYDNWSARGYDFLEGKIFYFRSPPEEIYYITFVEDSTELTNSSRIGLGIRAINRGNGKWQLEDDLNSSEKKRIEKRFHVEIAIKLEKLINVKTQK